MELIAQCRRRSVYAKLLGAKDDSHQRNKSQNHNRNHRGSPTQPVIQPKSERHAHHGSDTVGAPHSAQRPSSKTGLHGLSGSRYSHRKKQTFANSRNESTEKKNT